VTTDTDLIGQRWFAHENDLIGGWSILNVDRPPSEIDTRHGDREVGTFMTRRAAEHIVTLHNNSLNL
jgi:hypothetical protein